VSGVSRLLKSSKFWAAVLALLVIIAVQGFNVPEETAEKISKGAMVLVGLFIGGTTLEDVACNFAVGKPDGDEGE